MSQIMRPMNPDFVEYLEERGISIVDWAAAAIVEKGTIIQAYEQSRAQITTHIPLPNYLTNSNTWFSFFNWIFPEIPSPIVELSRKLHSIPVWHWDRCVKKSIPLPGESDAYLQLRCNILTAFQDEIERCPIRLYYLPFDFKNVDERVRISSSQDVDIFAELYLNRLKKDQGLPRLFVFNTSTESNSLDKLRVVSEVSTVISSDSESSSRCRHRDSNTCVFCGYCDSSPRDTCHIFEFKHYRAIKGDVAKFNRLSELGIIDINATNNLLSLCKNCHRAFDNYDLAVDSESMRLIVSLQALNTQVTKGKIPFSSLNGKLVKFSDSTIWNPPKQLLSYRLRFFDEKQLASSGKKKRKPTKKK